MSNIGEVKLTIARIFNSVDTLEDQLNVIMEFGLCIVADDEPYVVFPGTIGTQFHMNPLLAKITDQREVDLLEYYGIKVIMEQEHSLSATLNACQAINSPFYHVFR